MSSVHEIVPRLIDATVEIFTGMVMMDVSTTGEVIREMGPLRNSITGMVGMAGIRKGLIAVHFPYEVAFAVTSSFLGVEVDEMNEDVQDAVGEIANMLGGNVKTLLSDRGRDIELSLPSTISGDEYNFSSQDQVDQVILPFRAPAGIFHVELELEP